MNNKYYPKLFSLIYYIIFIKKTCCLFKLSNILKNVSLLRIIELKSHKKRKKKEKKCLLKK